jgi:predicted TIM-barrel fold metal-dependent hydrolase
MFIVDAQVHIWGPSTPERPWLAGRHPHRATPLGPDELLREMDAAGVARALLVAPSWDDDRNDYVLEAARAHPDRFAVMGRFNPEAPGAREQIEGWLSEPGMLGMRCTFTLQQKSALLEGRVDWLWERAAQAGVPIMALVTHAMAPLVERIAAHHPALKLSLCHLALDTGVKDLAAFRDFAQLLALAARPNITVMVSALPAYTSQPYPYPELQDYIGQVYEAFGPRRMFWGTDLARQPCTYRQAVTLFTEELPWLTPDDKALIMGRALCEWLGWPMPD